MGQPQQDTVQSAYLKLDTNSQFWITLGQLRLFIESSKDLEKDELIKQLLIGIENTKNRGYELSLSTSNAKDYD